MKYTKKQLALTLCSILSIATLPSLQAEDCVNGYHILYTGQLSVDPYNTPGFSQNPEDIVYFKWKSESDKQTYKEQKNSHGSVWVTPNAVRVDSIIQFFNILDTPSQPGILEEWLGINDQEISRRAGKNILVESFSAANIEDQGANQPVSVIQLGPDEEDGMQYSSYAMGVYKDHDCYESSEVIDAYYFCKNPQAAGLGFAESGAQVAGQPTYTNEDDADGTYLKLFDSYFKTSYDPNIAGFEGELSVSKVEPACLHLKDFGLSKGVYIDTGVKQKPFDQSFTDQ